MLIAFGHLCSLTSSRTDVVWEADVSIPSRTEDKKTRDLNIVCLDNKFTCCLVQDQWLKDNKIFSIFLIFLPF